MTSSSAASSPTGSQRDAGTGRDNRSANPAVVVVATGMFAIPPEPGTTRHFHLLTRLRRHARLYCVAAVTEPEAAWRAFLDRPEVTGLFESTVVCHRLAQFSPISQVMTLITGRPPLDLHYKDPQSLAATHKLIQQIAQEHAPVVFFCAGLSSLQFVPIEYWESCLVDSVDAVSMLTERRMRTDRLLSAGLKLKLQLALPRLRRFEARILARAGAVAYNSSADIAYMRRCYPEAPIVRVPDGCDLEYFSAQHVTEIQEEDNEIVFIGALAYPPNADAAGYLAETIMPLVWKQRSDVRAVIVGPDPPDRIRRLHDGKRIIVTGLVDDVRPHVKRAAIVVSPLRFGAGMKNKFQSGLAMGKAMVVSTVTCEGFDDLEPGRHMLVADTPEAFAAEICGLLADPERRLRMGAAGRERICQCYSWDAACEKLRHALKKCEPCVPKTAAQD